MRFAPLLALPLLTALAACATLSEDECRAGDWTQIGYEDGAAGRTPDFLDKHRKACEPYGIAPNVGDWLAGRTGGLPLYCTPRSAWSVGADGHRLSPVCPAEDQAALDRQNRRGLTFYRIGEDIAEAGREIDRIDALLASLPPDDPARAAMIADRAALRLDILSLRAERSLYRY